MFCTHNMQSLFSARPGIGVPPPGAPPLMAGARPPMLPPGMPGLPPMMMPPSKNDCQYFTILSDV